MKRFGAVFTIILTVYLLTFGLAVPAHAEEGAGAEVGSVLSDITSESTSAVTDVLENVAQVATDSVGDTAIDAEIGGVSINVPTDPSSPVSLESIAGNVITLQLPFANAASNAEVVAEGVVAYDNNNSSITAPVVKDDGSLQVTTIIQNTSAPTEYSYELSIPSGAVASLGDDGSVTILNADGTFVAGVAPAWAKDANGVAVPTHYVLSGSTLKQVVEHTTEGFVYPVVADPWLGIALVDKTRWSGNTLQVYPTYWARANPWASAGVAARWAGWDEVLSKTYGNRENTVSMRDQYYCHFDFVRFRAPNKVSWNLDLGRPAYSYATLVKRLCN